MRQEQRRHGVQRAIIRAGKHVSRFQVGAGLASLPVTPCFG